MRIYVSKSEKHNWQAVFISHSLLMGRSITLAAAPEPQRSGNEIIAGDVLYQDSAPNIFAFRWSKDRTLIAILTNEAIREVEQEPYTELYYTYAYDFLKNEIIKPPEKRPQADDPNIWNENSKQIKSLLDERGGADKFIYYQDMSFEKPNRQERKHWDNVLKKENRTR